MRGTPTLCSCRIDVCFGIEIVKVTFLVEVIPIVVVQMIAIEFGFTSFIKILIIVLVVVLV
jgi:hypothetical protein